MDEEVIRFIHEWDQSIGKVSELARILMGDDDCRAMFIEIYEEAADAWNESHAAQGCTLNELVEDVGLETVVQCVMIVAGMHQLLKWADDTGIEEE